MTKKPSNINNPKDEDFDFVLEEMLEATKIQKEAEQLHEVVIQKKSEPPKPEAEFEDVTESEELTEVDLEGDKNTEARAGGDTLLDRIESGESIHEAVRDIVYEAVQDVYKDETIFQPELIDSASKKGAALVEEKKEDLYQMLEHLDEQIAGKSVQEVSAMFSSLLNIQSQLCLQKTDGVITVKTRLSNFFTLEKNQTIRPELRQEISLIFTPEEVSAMRVRMADLREDDPLKPFFTTVLDQAYDVVQYNEMTGRLLIEMTGYFIKKLDNNGYGNTTKTLDFKERHERSKLSLEKSIGDLRSVELVVNKHLEDRPVLMELPRMLRGLIQIKLGLLNRNMTGKILSQIYALLGEYARARAAVAFDFHRLPSHQHAVHLRQSIIFNLHKDVLKYTGELFEKEFLFIKEELEKLMAEIESASEKLDPGSPEYEIKMKQKTLLMKKLEEHRRKLDVVRSQERLVDVQHKIVSETIHRYQKSEAIYKKLEEDLQQRSLVDKEKLENAPQPSKKKKREGGGTTIIGRKVTQS